MACVEHRKNDKILTKIRCLTEQRTERKRKWAYPTETNNGLPVMFALFKSVQPTLRHHEGGTLLCVHRGMASHWLVLTEYLVPIPQKPARVVQIYFRLACPECNGRWCDKALHGVLCRKPSVVALAASSSYMFYVYKVGINMWMPLLTSTWRSGIIN